MEKLGYLSAWMRWIKGVTKNCVVGKNRIPRYVYEEFTVATPAPIFYPEKPNNENWSQ